MPVTEITIGGDGTFMFCAAHAGLHDGQLEPLHGHSYIVTLRLHGDLDPAGMVCDFSAVKTALAAVIKPLRRCTLMPARLPGGPCQQRLLPVANTTTEAIAAWLLGQLMPRLQAPGIQRAELVLSEAPDTRVTVTAQPGAA
jgi:6-pyruvoyl-tetrahydropterin synthase